jgi:hypothetical protein
MDISVSHLNHRLALQLPAELPLGLVFVVGRVANLEEGENGRFSTPQFDLIEQSHRVRCVLSERTASEVTLNNGDRIRAGGHLAFDAQRAAYYLLVRDVEVVLPLTPVETAVSDEQNGLAAVLSDVKKRSDAARRTQTPLPAWVQKIAPPEVQAELPAAADEPPLPSYPMRRQEEVGLEADLLARLSAAMDSEDEVELTPEMLTELAVAAPEAVAETQTIVEEQDKETNTVEKTAVLPPPPPPPPAPSQPPKTTRQPQPTNSDTFLTALLVFFAIIAVLLIVVVVYLLL